MLYDSGIYPSSDWIKVIILGFISLIAMIGIPAGLNPFTLPFLVILPLTLGYLFKIIKTTFKGSDELPHLNEWKKMYRDGLKVILVAIIYAIPVIIISLTLFFSQMSMYNSQTINMNIFWGMFIISNLPLMMVFFIIGLIEIIAISNMALYEGEIGAAFRFSEIIERISMIGWIKYIIFYVIIWVLGLISAALSFMLLSLIIGIIIVPLLIVPYFIILITRLSALIFASSDA